MNQVNEVDLANIAEVHYLVLHLCWQMFLNVSIAMAKAKKHSHKAEAL